MTQNVGQDWVFAGCREVVKLGDYAQAAATL